MINSGADKISNHKKAGKEKQVYKRLVLHLDLTWYSTFQLRNQQKIPV